MGLPSFTVEWPIEYRFPIGGTVEVSNIPGIQDAALYEVVGYKQDADGETMILLRPKESAQRDAGNDGNE